MITSGLEIGMPIHDLIKLIQASKPIMMSDREYEELLNSCDRLKQAIVDIRRFGL